jgi:hypothetical protein
MINSTAFFLLYGNRGKRLELAVIDWNATNKVCVGQTAHLLHIRADETNTETIKFYLNFYALFQKKMR